MARHLPGALFAISVLMAAPALAGPATLTCTAEHAMGWQGETPNLVRLDDSVEEIGGPPMVHLDPKGGEWFLQLPGSRALTNGGGTFKIIVTSTFEHYYEEWVGIDYDTMLRIQGGAPYRFLFVSRDFAVLSGTCVAPEKPFLLLGDATS
jgi:hypothetical protein